MLEEIIEYIISVAVIIGFIKAMLKLSKIWKRKAIKDVAESISVTAQFMSLFTLSVWLLRAIVIEHSWIMSFDLIVAICMNLLFILIGSGIFIPGYKLDLPKAIWKSMKDEKNEIEDILSFKHTDKENELLAKIIIQISYLDSVQSEPEKDLIEKLLKSWDLDCDKLMAEKYPVQSEGLGRLRALLIDYLKLRPHKKHVQSVLDLINYFAAVDGVDTEIEEVMLKEVDPLLKDYIDDDKTLEGRFSVQFIPQSAQKINDVIGSHKLNTVINDLGGKVYKYGDYHSPKFAELIAKRFRDDDLVVLVVDKNLVLE